jgi:hypothetical protein
MWCSAGKQGEGGLVWEISDNTKEPIYESSAATWMTDGFTGDGGKVGMPNGFIRIKYLGD